MSMDRSTPAAGSMTYGTYRSPESWSRYDRSGRSARVDGQVVVVRVAMPSSSPHSVPGNS